MLNIQKTDLDKIFYIESIFTKPTKDSFDTVVPVAPESTKEHYLGSIFANQENRAIEVVGMSDVWILLKDCVMIPVLELEYKQEHYHLKTAFTAYLPINHWEFRESELSVRHVPSHAIKVLAGEMVKYLK